jgi:hypothetical protein
MDTSSVLQVEWLGDERVKPEVVGSSTGGHEVRIFRAKNRMSCDF